MLNWAGWSANFLGWLTGAPPVTPPAATPAVGGVYRGSRIERRRVLVEIRGGKVYEVDTAAEGRQVVQAIKRDAVRKVNRAAKAGAVLPPMPEITVSANEDAVWIDALRDNVAEVRFDIAALYAKMLEDDDEEAILLLL